MTGREACPTDAAQRRLALDPAESFIVQAPAGSGKTELLIQRFLTLLGHVDQPECVLAITFTRKAAGEMRDRIVQALTRAAGPAPSEPHALLTWDLARKVLDRDRQLDWRLTENPSRLRIQTIDSLCAELVRRMPWLSRFGAPPAIEEDSEPLYRQAARATVAMLESDAGCASSVERLLRHLDNDVSKVEELLARMSQKRDQWLRHIHSVDPDSARETLEAALAGVIREALAEVRGAIPPNTADEIASLACLAAANLHASGRESPIQACSDMTELPGTEPEDVPRWEGIAELLLTKGGTRRKSVNVSCGFPPAAKAAKARFETLALQLDDELCGRIHALRGLPPARFEDSQWEVLRALLDLLPVAVAQLRVIFQSEGAVDFVEIGQAARFALGTPEQPTDLAFSLDYRIQHLLVDEFQDTSQGQFELLRTLTADWLPGDGRTLFLVGDPMQSIYRFREADVGIFLQARESGIGSVELTPLTLSVNFRSDAGIVEWVNQAFQDAFPAVEDKLSGAVSYAPSVANRPASGEQAVTVHPFAGNDPEAEAARVIDVIRETRAADPAGTIAVLVRSRSHLVSIVPGLQQAGLRFRAVDIDQLGERPVVQDLLALTRALIHPADRPAWLAVLRAPWCGLTLADLLALAGDRWTVIPEALKTQNEPNSWPAGLSEDGRARLGRAGKVFTEALAERGRVPLRRWVEGTWLALGGPACLDDRTSLEDAAAYLDLLEASAEGSDLADLEAFAAQVSKLFARADLEADGKLQVMSVHKAKGLEFETVIVPSLGRKPRNDDPSLLQWLERVNGQGEAELLLAPIKEAGAKSDGICEYLKTVERQKAEHESTRLLYVAATRARKRLHLLGHCTIDEKKGAVRAPDHHSLLARIWPAVREVFEPLAASVRQVPEAGAPGQPPEAEERRLLLARLPAGWGMPQPPPGVEWRPEDGDAREREEISFHWVSEVQRHAGTVVHALLSQMAGTENSGWNATVIRAALAAEGVSPVDIEEAARRVEDALRETVSDARGRWLLAPHAEQQSELALAGLVNGRVRHFKIDRTFVDEDGVRWIVDFKTSTHEGGGLEAFLDNEQNRYRRQLEGYAQLFRNLDDRPIRLGLYFPLLREWREWEAEEEMAAEVGR